MFRGIEARSETPIDPLKTDEEKVADLRSFCGPSANFHHTVRWYGEHKGMIFGGLHNTADAAKQAFLNLPHLRKGVAYREIIFRRAKVIELREGQKYKPWGTNEVELVHGRDDGFHGSELRRNLPYREIVEKILRQG